MTEKLFDVYLKLSWPAEDIEAVQFDLDAEINNLDSMLFQTITYIVKPHEDDNIPKNSQEYDQLFEQNQ